MVKIIYNEILFANGEKNFFLNIKIVQIFENYSQLEMGEDLCVKGV